MTYSRKIYPKYQPQFDGVDGMTLKHRQTTSQEEYDQLLTEGFVPFSQVVREAEPVADTNELPEVKKTAKRGKRS